MGDSIDQTSNTDVDAMEELTLSSVPVDENVLVSNGSGFATPHDEQFGKRFLKDFKCVKEISCGSYGRVIEASNVIDEKHYAIKIIPCPKSDQVMSKVLREVTSMAKLMHENIVRYHTAWIDPSPGEKSHLYIQMELCEKTLNDWLFENTGPRDCRQVLGYFRQIVSALDVIHSWNLIHRDLKPSNIFISKNGVIKVGDFGEVTIHSVLDEVEQDAATDSSCIHSRNKGTPLYRSPEQLEKKNYDSKSDIFSLGLIYLELCIPLQVEERKQMFERAREGRFPKEERFPNPRCEDLLHDMLERNPERRSTAKEILKHPVLNSNAKTNSTSGNNTINYFGKIKATNMMTGPGAVMYVSSGQNTQVKKIKATPQKPLTKSQEQPSIDQVLDIKEKVGAHWKDLGRRLGFEDSILEQMHLEYQTLDETIYQILLKWKQRENAKASREYLAQVFMKLGRGDLADLLADD